MNHDRSIQPDFLNEMHELLWRLRSQSADAAELARLELLVCSEPAARRMYVQYLDMCASLHWADAAKGEGRSASPRAVPVATVELAANDTHTPPSPPSPNSAKDAKQPARAATASRWSARIVQSLISAAVAVLLLVSVMALLRHQPERTVVEHVENSLASLEIAQVTSENVTDWGQTPLPLDERELLAAGKSVAFLSGQLELTFKTGTRLLLQGPVSFRLDANDRVTLDRGRMTALVPRRARGFAVHTNRFQIVDLGTEFGALVEDDGAVEVHVFRGEVELRPHGEKSSADGAVQLKDGMAWRIAADAPPVEPNPAEPPPPAVADAGGSPAGKPIEFRPDQFLPILPHAPRKPSEAERPLEETYALAVLAERPVAYWQFDDADIRDGARAQDSAGVRHGRYVGSVRSTPGAFDSGIAALLDGESHIDIAGFRRPTAAYSYIVWFRPAEELNAASQRVDLFYGLGERETSERPHLSHNRAAAGVQEPGLRFFAQLSESLDDQHTPLRVENRAWEANHWYCVVVTFDGETYRLHIDGELAAEQALAGSNLPSIGLRIGASHARAPLLLRPGFRGAIDDVAVFDRALSKSAVSRLWRAARETDEK